MDQGLQCESRRRLAKARIACPECWRDYSLYTVHHVCNPIVKCGLQGQVFRMEEYIPLDPGTPVECRALCDECVAAKRKLTEPRKGECPTCKYEGRYVYSDDDPRCAACKTATLNEPRVSCETVSAGDPIVTPARPKPLKLYLHVEREDPRDISPDDGRDAGISFHVEHFTDASMLTDKWQVLCCQTFGMVRCSDQGETSLNEHLWHLRDQGYEWSWVVEKRIDWMLLKHYFDKEERENNIGVSLGEFTM